MPCAFWNLARAVLVAAPNVVVSFPADPTPFIDTGAPCAFRYCWSALTSLPSEPVVKSALNACTAALVTEPVAVPSSDAFTFAMTSASALKDASTSNMDLICADERPEAGVAGAEGVVGTAGVAGVAGVADADDELLDELLLEEPPLLPPDEPPPPPWQSVLDGVKVIVSVTVGAKVRTDWMLLHIALERPVGVL